MLQVGIEKLKRIRTLAAIFQSKTCISNNTIIHHSISSNQYAVNWNLSCWQYSRDYSSRNYGTQPSSPNNNQKIKTMSLSITIKKKEDLGLWYQEVLTKSEMIEYYPDVSGCYILRPWSFRIWEQVQGFLQKETSAMGVEPCYFPMFVSEEALKREAEHVEDFAPEVAWVTHSGKTELEKPLAIRPTSETIMYPAFARWIRSHRDLPLRVVQYCNVVRWEFKSPVPFLRTREFLWQEGHTAWENKEDADAEVLEALDMYARVYEELLAVPVVKGRKSHKEKFAGGDFTTTVEAFIPVAGRAIQGATSHSLGQNFAKMFDISFAGGEEGSGGKNPENKNYAWQNSWGITTRVIGVMVMVHGDDKGLVLPPRVAPIQVVGIYVYSTKNDPETVKKLRETCEQLLMDLEDAGIRVRFDDRERTPGFKYAHWEQKGVPLRLEIGPKDLEKGEVVLVRRDDGSKTSIKYNDVDNPFVEQITTMLEAVQTSMLSKARAERDARVTIAWTWDEFLEGLRLGNLVLTPWCCTTESEDWVKAETAPQKLKEVFATTAGEGEGKIPLGSAKTLCIPFNQPHMPIGTKCFTGRGDAVSWCMWGRSY